MIDLHSHLLPGVDDGAKDLEMSLQMARLAVAEGITMMACTPHFYPGVYDLHGPDVLARIASLQFELDHNNIPLKLVSGGDLRLEPGLVARLRTGDALTIHGSRYALIEPAHQLFTHGMERFFSDILSAGFQPILTHPERMAWIEQRSDSIDRLCLSGVWLQITSGAVIGHFGRRAQYWSERLICEGKAHILASDTHDPHHRPPLMREAFDRVAGWVGDAEAMNMVHHRPRLVLENGSPNSILVDAPSQMRDHTAARSLWGSVKSFILKN